MAARPIAMCRFLGLVHFVGFFVGLVGLVVFFMISVDFAEFFVIPDTPSPELCFLDVLLPEVVPLFKGEIS